MKLFSSDLEQEIVKNMANEIAANVDRQILEKFITTATEPESLKKIEMIISKETIL